MPITDCKIHGESGCPEMCKHLKENLEKGIFLSFHELPVYTIRMCDGCFEKYNIKNVISSVNINESSISDKRKKEKGIYKIAPNYYFEIDILKEKNPEMLKKIEHIYNELNKKSGFKCSDCIDNIQLSHARKNSLELPFEPFENTIIHSDDKKICKLQKMLDKHLVSLHLTKPTCCSIISGAVSRPLSIKIYGVTTKESQKDLLKLIDKFFEKISQKQRRIIFFEPLNWIVEKLENGMTRKYRDKVKVLSDIIIK